MDAVPAADGLNFELPEEIRMLKDTVRKFVDRELIPIERTARNNNKLKPEVRAHLTAKAKELGLAGYDVPQEYGGLGMGLIAKVTVWAELGRTIALPSRGVDVFGPNVSPILYHLNEEQKKKYLLPTIRGELNWCLAQTEPDAGGDPGGMRTTAVRQGDHYVINGTKRFITGADEAHFTQLIAATDRAKGSRGGISAFIVDMKAPGVRLLRAAGARGRRPAWEIAFENVKVPVENRIGEEGDGFSHAQHWLNVGRIRHGARGIGVIERCLELGTQIRQAARDLRQAAGGAAGGAMDAGRQLHGAAPAPADGLRCRLEIRSGTRHPHRGLYGEDFRRHPVLPRRRPLHGDPRRHGACDRSADREILARPAQHDDHRGPDRNSQDGARTARAADLRLTRRTLAEQPETGGRRSWPNTSTNARKCESTTASAG